jgi:hypothetical protein
MEGLMLELIVQLTDMQLLNPEQKRTQIDGKFGV